MPVTENIGRRQCIPIIYTRGTHYEVGFDVGRTFAFIIQGFLESFTSLHEDFLPAYNTPEGRLAYDKTLDCVKANFPQYVDEIQGTADGAKVPFHELFLMHMDNIILSNGKKENSKKLPVGCSTICLNQPGQETLGHTEDALSETLNNFYFVSAHIISDKPQGRWNITEEKFTSLCYAGHLPGYTMSYNHHGLVFSINTLSAQNLIPGRTPRNFLTRALLAAENYGQVLKFLKDEGTGAADGCSINMTFAQEEERIFYNIEIAPTEKSRETQLSTIAAKSGEYLLHCNAYQRISLPESNHFMLESSKHRMNVFDKCGVPKEQRDVVKMLGDTSHTDFPVFHDEEGRVKTIAVGIFDFVEKTWSLYSDNPKKNEPLTVLPLLTTSIKSSFK